jgi:hypothetical protein
VQRKDAVKIERIGTFIDWELSYKLGFQRPERVRVVIARAKYEVPAPEATAASVEAPASEAPVVKRMLAKPPSLPPPSTCRTS